MLINKNNTSCNMKKVVLSTSVLVSTILMALFLLMSLPVASALTASISNPRMVLYKNISAGEEVVFENSVIVNNDNENSVTITIKPLDVWEGRVEINEEDKSFSMKPGERREVVYNVSVEQAGYYEGDVLVTFTEEEDTSRYLSLAQELVVIVQDENGQVPGKITGSAVGNSDLNSTILLSAGATLFVIAVLVVLFSFARINGQNRARGARKLNRTGNLNQNKIRRTEK